MTQRQAGEDMPQQPLEGRLEVRRKGGGGDFVRDEGVQVWEVNEVAHCFRLVARRNQPRHAERQIRTHLGQKTSLCQPSGYTDTPCCASSFAMSDIRRGICR